MSRFDLEEKINGTYDFIDRLNDISYGALELELTNEEISDAIHGVATLLKLHIERTVDSFKKTFGLDEYRDDLK